jgi:hypothetical protein
MNTVVARSTLLATYGASLLVVGGLALAAAATSAAGCTRGEALDPSKMPEGVRADYALFAQKCSKCHSLARPLSANITDDTQWVLYVNRMRRQPGSGISLEDQDGILRFLRWYAADLRRIEAEKRGGTPPSGGAPAPAQPPTHTPATPAPPPPSAPEGKAS